MRARKKLKDVELKMLSLKIRKDVWLAWKMRAAIEETTMSELAERLVVEYIREAGVDIANWGRSRGAVEDKAAHRARSGASRGRGRKVVQVQAKRR